MSDPVGPASATEKSRGQLFQLQIESHARFELKDVTSQIEKLVEKSGVTSGVCHVFVPHTSAAILINENYDPGLRKDIEEFLKKLAPAAAAYHHDDGNCDAHLKSILIGASKTLLVEHGRLLLGRWQGVFLCEFDGPRRRELRVKIVQD
jgi:secondary thiamine-phosphate synthase enzyme